jgi:DNA-binding response OmpR family regulator
LRDVKKRILLVEDDEALARVLEDNLVFEGFEVVWAADGESAFDKVRAVRPDLILLDIMLPGTDGFDLIGRLGSKRRTPIIMLTARVRKSDRLRGLNLGADDYITKPFDLEELLARVNAVLRRTRPAIDRLTLGDMFIDFRSMVVRCVARDIQLTHREFELLRYLAERQEQVVDRDELLREVWGYPETPLTRSVDHAIARLRKKIEPDVHRPRFIHTIHGDGYCLTPRGRPVPAVPYVRAVPP